MKLVENWYCRLDPHGVFKLIRIGQTILFFLLWWWIDSGGI